MFALHAVKGLSSDSRSGRHCSVLTVVLFTVVVKRGTVSVWTPQPAPLVANCVTQCRQPRRCSQTQTTFFHGELVGQQFANFDRLIELDSVRQLNGFGPNRKCTWTTVNRRRCLFEFLTVSVWKQFLLWRLNKPWSLARTVLFAQTATFTVAIRFGNGHQTLGLKHRTFFVVELRKPNFFEVFSVREQNKRTTETETTKTKLIETLLMDIPKINFWKVQIMAISSCWGAILEDFPTFSAFGTFLVRKNSL